HPARRGRRERGLAGRARLRDPEPVRRERPVEHLPGSVQDQHRIPVAEPQHLSQVTVHLAVERDLAVRRQARALGPPCRRRVPRPPPPPPPPLPRASRSRRTSARSCAPPWRASSPRTKAP